MIPIYTLVDVKRRIVPVQTTYINRLFAIFTATSTKNNLYYIDRMNNYL